MQATALREPRRAARVRPAAIAAALAPHSIYIGQRGARCAGSPSSRAERGRPGPDPPLRDRAGGRRLHRRARRAPRRLPRPPRAARASARVLAHGVWLDDDELELIAARGATVVTNPVANMKLAVGGVFPYPAARAAGVAVGLGTDGAGSNDSLDLLADLKIFALAQKHAAADADRDRRRRGLGGRDRRRARRCSAPARSRSASRPTSSCCDADAPELGDRRAHRRPRLRRLGLGRRHHRRRRPRADARRRGAGARGDRRPRRRARPPPRPLTEG